MPHKQRQTPGEREDASLIRSCFASIISVDLPNAGWRSRREWMKVSNFTNRWECSISSVVHPPNAEERSKSTFINWRLRKNLFTWGQYCPYVRKRPKYKRYTHHAPNLSTALAIILVIYHDNILVLARRHRLHLERRNRIMQEIEREGYCQKKMPHKQRQKEKTQVS